MTDKALTKRQRTELVIPDLTTKQLELVHDLAKEGTSEALIRKCLELTPGQWKKLKEDDEDGDPSPLSLALIEGRAEGAGEVVTFFKARMAEGSETAALFLADRIYKIEKGGEDKETGARVLIQINQQLSPEDYQRVIVAHETR